jgi:hypothetical protein
MQLQRSILRNTIATLSIILALATSVPAQQKRLWVLRPSGEMAEYDPVTFAPKSIIKVPADVLTSPQGLSINRLGQMLFAPSVSLPLAEDDLPAGKTVWLSNGHTVTTLTRDVSRVTSTAGSNLAITESAPTPFLSADGAHVFWFSNQARRLQRDGVDLSTKNTWQAWQTDLAGAARQDVASIALPDCPCPTGGCEETCPYEETWAPEGGVGKFFLVTRFVSSKTQPVYQATALYEEDSGKWSATPLHPPLRRILDAAGPAAILEAIPDTACCGWENQSDDQTLLRLREDSLTVFDEQVAYKNPDYDVSFYTTNSKVSPNLGSVAVTIAATAASNKPIQLSEEGQANPEESQRIRKALLDLPAVEVKSVVDNPPRRTAFLTHCTLVGWVSEKEILIVEGNLLVVYNISNGSRHKSSIRVEDAAHVFLR